MRRFLVLILLCLPLATAQIVSIADADGDELEILPARVAFIDADRDGKIDHGDQEEPIYIDAHDDGVVNRGDVRLTGHFGPAGTSVELGDPDFGLDLQSSTAWFANTGDSWFLDTDGSRTITAGDIRLTGAAPGARVLATDNDVGRATPAIQATVDRNQRIGWTDPDGDGRVDPGEPIYLDLEHRSGTPQRVEAGDLYFINAVQTPEAEPGILEEQEPAGDTSVTVDDDDGGVEWGTILGVVDLLGLIGLTVWVVRKG